MGMDIAKTAATTGLSCSGTSPDQDTDFPSPWMDLWIRADVLISPLTRRGVQVEICSAYSLHGWMSTGHVNCPHGQICMLAQSISGWQEGVCTNPQGS